MIFTAFYVIRWVHWYAFLQEIFFIKTKIVIFVSYTKHTSILCCACTKPLLPVIGNDNILSTSIVRMCTLMENICRSIRIFPESPTLHNSWKRKTSCSHLPRSVKKHSFVEILVFITFIMLGWKGHMILILIDVTSRYRYGPTWRHIYSLSKEEKVWK